MKDFLYNKFVSLHPENLVDFQKEITKSLPTFGPPIIHNDESTTMWGYDNGNFWVTTNVEARYYEPSGIVHVISTTKDKAYYDICTSLYNIGYARKQSVPQPLEFSSHPLEYKDHPSGKDTVSYMKFKTADGKYGYTPFMIHVLTGAGAIKVDEMVNYFKNIVDTMALLYTDLKKLNSTGYPKWPGNDILNTGDGAIFLMVPDLTLDITDSVDICLRVIDETKSEVEGIAKELNVELSSIDISNYARNVWTPLLTN